MNVVPERNECYVEEGEPIKIGALDRPKQKLRLVLDSLIHGQNEYDRSDNEMLKTTLGAMEPMSTEDGKQKKNEEIKWMHQETLESKERNRKNTNETILILAGLALIGLKIWCDSNKK